MDPEFLSSDDEEFDVILDDDDDELNDIELFQQRSNGTRCHCIEMKSVIQVPHQPMSCIFSSLPAPLYANSAWISIVIGAPCIGTSSCIPPRIAVAQ